MSKSQLLPLFLDLEGRRVLLVGGGRVAAAKLAQLLAVHADVRVVSPEVCDEIEQSGVAIERRPFEPEDLDGVWLVVAAAMPEANRAVAESAERRRVFVNAVDDPANASAFLGGVVRRDGVTLAISTGGAAPGLAALLRQALDQVLPRDLSAWVEEARLQRIAWRRDGVPMEQRRPLLLRALNELYTSTTEHTEHTEKDHLFKTTTEHTECTEEDHLLKTTTEYTECTEEDHLLETTTEHTEENHLLTTTTEHTEHTEKPHPISEDSVSSVISVVNAPSGHVSLVGAGPGDPGLLTRRAVDRLRAADLVLYDALIDPGVLKLARRAQRFFVGKRALRQAMSQEAINALMIRAARRGKRVVRLKGGDPFVFGRGGEETLALGAAGVGFDVVPGVTSATAAPALAGIPVTHRGVSSAFLVVGGHDVEAFARAIDAVAPNVLTLIVMMGVGRRATIARRLIERGWDARTPSAVVVDASRPTQAVWWGTLEQLSSEHAEIEHDGPGTIVIGQVVDVGHHKAGEFGPRESGEFGHLGISSSGH